MSSPNDNAPPFVDGFPLPAEGLNRLAPLDSPTFSGVPTAPTADQGDDSERLATTSYVDEAIALAPITDLSATFAPFVNAQPILTTPTEQEIDLIPNVLGSTTRQQQQPWSPVIRQNLGGESSGHMYVWADQNATITPCDHFQIRDANPGGAAVIITGTPVAGQQVGIVLTVNSVPYTVKYTAQSSDTTLILVMEGLQACIIDDRTAPHCTVSPSSLTEALLAIGYWTAAGNAQLGAINLDVPIPAATSLVGVSSLDMTVTTFPNGSLADVLTDNGPYFSAVAYNPGRPGKAGDAIGFYRMDGQSSTGNIDTQYAGIFARIIDPTSGAQQGELRLAAANGLGNPAAVAALAVSQGDYSDNGSGSGSLLADPGFGKAMRIGYYLTATDEPATPPSGQFAIYMDVADGKLKAKGPSGTVTTLANP
jgi:hypothetical protein